MFRTTSPPRRSLYCKFVRECCQLAERIYPYLCPLTALIIQQNSSYSHSMKMEQQREKQQIKNDQWKEWENQAAILYQQLPEQMQRAMDCSSKKGASNVLSMLPIAEHGFALHKGVFRDALCLRYGWHPRHLPTECVWQTVHS